MLPHFGLVIPSIALNVRIPPVFSLTVSAGREKRVDEAHRLKMSNVAKAALAPLRDSFFVLWDTKDGRGWMVNGSVVALHILRAHLAALPPPDEPFDFYKLKHINDETPSAAYDVLTDPDNVAQLIYKVTKDVKKKPGDAQESKDEGDEEWTTLGGSVLSIIEVLKTLEQAAKTIDLPPNGHSSWFQEWYGKRWSLTVRGWDFKQITDGKSTDVFVHKFDKDPGWLRLTRALKTPFLFGSDFGEILQPHDGHCCPHFRTLPKGHDYLAIGMDTIQSRINHECGYGDPKETVARLAREIAWERGVGPFSQSHSQDKHPEKVDSNCFPVQHISTVPPFRKGKDKDVLKEKKGRPYSWQEADDLNTAPKDVGKKPPDKSPKLGVVVFGKTPDEKRLKQLAQAHSPRNHHSGTSQTPSATSSSTTPASHANTQGVTGPLGANSAANVGDVVTGSQSRPNNNGGRPAESSSSATVASQSQTPTQQFQAGATQPRSNSNSLRSNASASDARSTRTPTNGSGQPTVTSARRAPSASSLNSTHSGTPIRAPGTGSDAERPRAPTSQVSSTLAHRAASNASLRSTGSNTRPNATSAGSVQPHVPLAQTIMPIATRQASNSSTRTTSSVASKATGGPDPQAPAGQLSTAGLKKTTTNSSDKSTNSRSSRNTQSSAAGSTGPNNRQRQQRPEQLGSAPAAAGNVAPGQSSSANHGPSVTAINPHSNSSGAAPTGGSGPDGSS